MPVKNSWSKSLFVTACLALAFVAVGQAQPFCTTKFLALTKSDGLTGDGYNNFVYQDQFGFIWVSSLEGVNRFDGMDVRNYVEIPEDSTSILGQNIQSNFHETPTGDLWFSSYVALNRYIRTEDRFEPVQLEVNGRLIDKDYRVFHLEADRGDLWMRADTHLIVFNTSNRSYRLLPCKSQAMTFGVATDVHFKPNRIVGSFWGERGFEYHYRDAAGDWHLQEFREDWTPNGAAENFVYKRVIVEDSTDFWLLATEGLLHFNPKHPECSTFYPSPNGIRLGGGLVFQKGLLLLNTNDGFQFFDSKYGSYLPERCRPLPLEEHALAQEIYKLGPAADAGIWVRLKGKGLRYARKLSGSGFSAVDFKLRGGRQPIIEHLVPDGKGRYWVGTRNRGIFLFSDAGQLRKHYPLPEQVGPKLNHLSIDAEGIVWALSEHQVFQYDPDLDTFLPITEAGVTSRLIALHQLPSGRKLVATSLGLFDLRQRGSAYELIRAPEFEAYQELSFLRSFRSSDGSFWLSYSSKELWRYRETPDGQLKQIERVSVDAEIFSFYEEVQQGLIWVGTSRGLIQLDLGSKPAGVQPFLQKDWEIGRIQVYCIQKDRLQKLWISSSRGLFCYDPAQQLLQRFREQDGLPNTKFSYLASAVNDSGELWFGTLEGLLRVQPDKVDLNAVPVTVHIEELLVNNAPYERGNVHVNFDSLIVLDHLENTLAFQLKAVTTSGADRCQLRFHLKNYDERWTIIENGDYARFTQVPPGRYALEIHALDANGLSSPRKTLNVRINPPFYQRSWFRAFVGLTAVVLIFLAVNTLLQRSRRKQRLLLEKQQAREEERSRIAQELHDSMGTGISVIQFLTARVRNPEDVDKVSGLFKKVNRKSHDLLQEMQDIVWALKPENDRLRVLVQQMQGFLDEYLKLADLPYVFRCGPNLQDIELSGERRLNTFLIFKESIHNIVRHAEAGRVDIWLEVQEGQLLLRIKDDGKGMDLAERRKGGRSGLAGLYKRAEKLKGNLEIQTAPGKGTTIELQYSIS